MSAREPVLGEVAIADLRPTQMTVGFREVAEKRRDWRDRSSKSDEAFIGRHTVPTVLGPGGRYYLIDHHHLALALVEEDQKNVLVNVVADLSSLGKASFWIYLDNRAWCHPYDAAGRRREFTDIPKHITDLADDPYRSLAGELRRAGGFAKDSAPYSEFLWADFLRSRVKEKQVRERFAAALEKALGLSRSKAADYLPGWCGPDAD